MKKIKATNPELITLIHLLKKHSNESKANIWRDIAERLAKPNKKRVAVNISRLNRYTQKNETVAVPGKVLGTGEMNHSLTVAAFSFSTSAKGKITAAKGKCLTYADLIKKNPKGSKVRIFG